MPEIRVNQEYAGSVPPLTKITLDSLVSSIQADGLHERITVNEEGIVLDGHNRLRACQKLGITCEYKIKEV